MNTLLVFVKFPQAGQVKTRLCPPLTPQEAADFYTAMLQDSLDTYLSNSNLNISIQISPPEKKSDFENILGKDFKLVNQVSGDLGQRMFAAFETALRTGATKAIAIGTDHPSLPPVRLEQAAAALDTHDLVLGPALDGGYYLMGMKKPHLALFEGISWSSPQVMAQTKAKALELDLKTAVLEAWYDVDELSDIAALEKDLRISPNLAPRSADWLNKWRAGMA